MSLRRLTTALSLFAVVSLTLPAFADALERPRSARTRVQGGGLGTALGRARATQRRQSERFHSGDVTLEPGTSNERTMQLYRQTEHVRPDATKGMRVPNGRRGSHLRRWAQLYRNGRGPLRYTRAHASAPRTEQEVAAELTQAGVTPQNAARAARQARLGLPSNANASNRNDLLLARYDMVISYNDAMRGPNWISWTTTPADLGSARMDDFRDDPMLPGGVHAATLEDYADVHGAVHIGHLLRSQERSRTPRANSRSFLLTNTLPQAENSNVGPWLHFENTLLDRVKREGKTIHVMAGAVWGRNPIRIGANRVAVPQAMWKVAVVLEPGQSVADIDASTPVFAGIFPNSNDDIGVSEFWTSYQTTVADVERATGHQFFTNLPENVANALRNRIDAAPAARRASFGARVAAPPVTTETLPEPEAPYARGR